MRASCAALAGAWRSGGYGGEEPQIRANMAKLRTLLSVRVHFLPARVLLAIVVIIVSLQRIRNFNVVVHRLDVRLLLAENRAGDDQFLDNQILRFEPGSNIGNTQKGIVSSMFRRLLASCDLHIEFGSGLICGQCQPARND